MALNMVQAGKTVKIKNIKLSELHKSRLEVLGVKINQNITLLKNIKLGVVICCNGQQIALCRYIAQNITVYEQ